MKIRKIFAGMSALALAASMAVSASAASLKTITGGAEEKTDFWNTDGSYFVDTTKIDRSKIDKIIIEYTSTAIWCNGKIAANINLDKNTSSGNWKGFEWTSPKGGDQGECLLWDLKDGQPQYNDNPVSGENFKTTWDVKTKKGSIEWSDIIAQGGIFDGRYSKGTKKFDPADDEFDPKGEGDAAGIVLQVGTMSNVPVVPDSEKNNPDFKATSWTPAKFEVTAVKLLDKDGKLLNGGSDSASSSKTDTTSSTASGDNGGNTSSGSGTGNTSSGSNDNGTSDNGSAGGSDNGNTSGGDANGNDGNTADANGNGSDNQSGDTNKSDNGGNGNSETPTNGDSGAQGGGNGGNAASGDTTNPGTGAASGAALAGIAIAGAAIVLSKKKK